MVFRKILLVDDKTIQYLAYLVLRKLQLTEQTMVFLMASVPSIACGGIASRKVPMAVWT